MRAQSCAQTSLREQNKTIKMNVVRLIAFSLARASLEDSLFSKPDLCPNAELETPNCSFPQERLSIAVL